MELAAKTLDWSWVTTLPWPKEKLLLGANSMLSFSHPHFLSALTLMNDFLEPKPASKGYVQFCRVFSEVKSNTILDFYEPDKHLKICIKQP